jgi:hypothetical protein
MRPKRLFGFDGTTGEDPRSPTGLVSLGRFGLAPATAPVTLTCEVIRELQGSPAIIASKLRRAGSKTGPTDALRLVGAISLTAVVGGPHPHQRLQKS